MRGRGNGAGLVSVPDNEVGVRAFLNRPLLGENVKDLGSVGGGHGDKAGRIHFPGVNALLPDNRHSILKAVDPVRDFAKVLSSLYRGKQGYLG